MWKGGKLTGLERRRVVVVTWWSGDDFQTARRTGGKTAAAKEQRAEGLEEREVVEVVEARRQSKSRGVVDGVDGENAVQSKWPLWGGRGSPRKRRAGIIWFLVSVVGGFGLRVGHWIPLLEF
jgi:hypothetical protein